jgi:hypothetical protein
MLWQYFGEQWILNQKVNFDGVLKRITIAPGVTTLSVKVDLYSDWKEWSLIYDNMKYLPAFRSIGGDPVGGGLYAGDMYFLMNGWQIIIDHAVALSGILYHDDGLSPFIIMPGGGVSSTVSSLAYAYNTTGAATPPTVLEIRNEIDNNSTQLAAIKAKTDTITAMPTVPTAVDIATAVWDTTASAHTTAGTTGEKLANIAVDTTTIKANVANLQVTADTILGLTV